MAGQQEVRTKGKFSLNQMKRICFVHTGGVGDDGAFERAVRLSERTGSELNIVAVAEQPPGNWVRLLHSFDAEFDPSSLTADHTAAFERFVNEADRRNVAASAEILQGRPGIEIIRKVIREGPDLLVKSAQPATGIQRILFGYTDRQLIRQCPCPVWIEKPSSGRSHDRILAAVDPATDLDDPDVDPQREALNVSILEFAVLLAEVEQAALDVVHVWPFYIEDYLQSRGGLTEAAVTEIARSVRRKHEDAVAALLAPYAGRVAHVHVVKGQPAAEIARVAAGQMAEAVVMGTVCRTGVSGMIIGNTAETLLDQIDCSVVALKPAGFLSPVEPM